MPRRGQPGQKVGNFKDRIPGLICFILFIVFFIIGAFIARDTGRPFCAFLSIIALTVSLVMATDDYDGEQDKK